jgi:hypothetical protein
MQGICHSSAEKGISNHWNLPGFSVNFSADFIEDVFNPLEFKSAEILLAFHDLSAANKL